MAKVIDVKVEMDEKSATELVKQFSSLEDLYNNIDKIEKARVKNALLENKENAFLSYRLFLLKEYDINITEEKLVFDINNWKHARPLFENLEFKSLIKDISQKHEDIQPTIFFADEKGYQFKCITEYEELLDLANYLKSKKTFAFDVETPGKAICASSIKLPNSKIKFFCSNKSLGGDCLPALYS